jgi:NitT/TauT family transport system ATP-binding protein
MGVASSIPQVCPHRVSGLGVKLVGVRKMFAGGVVAVDGIDLEVRPGEFLAILGPSGCGKSTLLRIVAGLERADAGGVMIEDQPSGNATQADESRPETPVRYARPEHMEIAYVFQDAHLLPWRTVLRNVELPLELRGTPRTERRAAAAEALEQVGLGDALRRYPAQLSGGMRMRVSLARALVTRPRLLLLDEPFAALDEINRQRLDEQLHQLWLDYRTTVLFVTHSTAEATFLAQRAVVMSRRPGRIILDQPLDLPLQRDAELRTDPRMLQAMRDVFEALERSEKGDA